MGREYTSFFFPKNRYPPKERINSINCKKRKQNAQYVNGVSMEMKK